MDGQTNRPNQFVPFGWGWAVGGGAGVSDFFL